VAEILSALPHEPGGQAAPYAPRHARGLARFEGYLRGGQRKGQLRRFSVGVTAMAIRAASDAVAYRLTDEPDLDLAGFLEPSRGSSQASPSPANRLPPTT
jgi:hypothetical protein